MGREGLELQQEAVLPSSPLPGSFSYVDVIEQAVVAGDTVLIENLEETIDPVLDPLLGRHTIKKGR